MYGNFQKERDQQIYFFFLRSTDLKKEKQSLVTFNLTHKRWSLLINWCAFLQTSSSDNVYISNRIYMHVCVYLVYIIYMYMDETEREREKRKTVYVYRFFQSLATHVKVFFANIDVSKPYGHIFHFLLPTELLIVSLAISHSYSVSYLRLFFTFFFHIILSKACIIFL